MNPLHPFVIDLTETKDRNSLNKRQIERSIERNDPFGHLKAPDRSRLQQIENGATLCGFPSDHDIDVLVANLFAELPWMRQTLCALHRHLLASHQKDGRLAFPPILLVGPAGLGKTHLARELALATNAPFLTHDVSTSTEAFGLIGLTRGWSSSAPGRLIETIIDQKAMNPVVLVDEIDKAPHRDSEGPSKTSIIHGLLGLLEKSSAARWTCPYYQVAFDMSKVNWILTANSLRDLPGPLLSRVEVFKVKGPSHEELMQAAHSVGRARDINTDLVDQIEPLLRCYPPAHPSLNMRTVLRLIDGIQSTQSARFMNS